MDINHTSEFFQPVIDNFKKIQDIRREILSFRSDTEYTNLSTWFAENDNINEYQEAIDSIVNNFKFSYNNLAMEDIVLCIYGNVNAGKSTLGNLLVGAELLTVSNAPCTAVPTVLSSGTYTNKGRVYFSEGDFL
jgi:predicted GTPase